MISLLRGPYVPASCNPVWEGPHDLIVVPDYSGIPDRTGGSVLPLVSVVALIEAAHWYKNGCGKKIIWGSSDSPGIPAKTLNTAKLGFLFERSVQSDSAISVVAQNPIQEVRAIEKKCPGARRILLICDEAQARLYLKLLRHFYRPAIINLVTVRATWKEENPNPWQKSEARWWAYNMTQHALMLLMGMKLYIKCFENRIRCGVDKALCI